VKETTSLQREGGILFHLLSSISKGGKKGEVFSRGKGKKRGFPSALLSARVVRGEGKKRGGNKKGKLLCLFCRPVRREREEKRGNVCVSR